MKNLLRTYLQKSCISKTWKAWFEPLSVRYDATAAELTVTFPHVFFQPWFAQEAQKIFEKSVQYISKEHCHRTIDILYKNPQTSQPQALFFQKTSTHDVVEQAFSHFIHNAKNAFPIAAICEVAQGNFPLKYNPLFICGKSNTGKTHILQALFTAFSAKDGKEIHIFQGDSHTFYEQLAKFGATYLTDTFSIFLLDNIHYYEPATVLQDRIISFIDLCLLKQKQLILTSLFAPTLLTQYTETLRARLQAGLVVELKEADIDVRMRFALFHCKQYGIKISREQLLILAQRCTTIAHLRGIILKIHAFQALSKEECSLTDIENILHATDSGIKKLSLQDIIHAVATQTDVVPEDILGKKRQPQIVRARQIAMYLCRQLLGLSYSHLGKYFGGKDHTTVIHSIKKIKELTVSNKDVHKIVTEVKQSFLYQ